MKHVFSISLVALALTAVAPAQAAPFGSLVFDTPTANVLSNQPIDIWVTFTLDAGSAPLVLDGAGGELSNGTLDPGDIPAAWLSSNPSQLSSYYVCSGTFTNVCSPAAYSFDFNFDPADTVLGIFVFDLQPGQSHSFKFGTFNPVGGNAPAGTYEFFGAGFTLLLTGTVQKTDVNGAPVFYAANEQLVDLFGNPQFDVNGDPVLAVGGEPVIVHVDNRITLGDTTGSGISFVRNVTAVPEPETWAMLLAGLGLVGFVVRRRRV